MLLLKVSGWIIEKKKQKKKQKTAELLKQGYRYHKLRKTFSNLYRRHSELMSKYNIGLKKHLQIDLLGIEFHGE